MCQVKLIGAYAKEADFEKELNEFISKFDYSNLDIKYQMSMNEGEVLYSALIIIKDCRWLEKTQTSLTEKVLSQNTEPVLNLGIIYLFSSELITIRNNWEELKSLSKNIMQKLLGLIYIIMGGFDMIYFIHLVILIIYSAILHQYYLIIIKGFDTSSWSIILLQSIGIVFTSSILLFILLCFSVMVHIGYEFKNE